MKMGSRFSHCFLILLLSLLIAFSASHASAQLTEVTDGRSRFSTNITGTAIKASQVVKLSGPTTGDVSGDGTLSMVDAAMIKNHLLEIQLLTGDALARADANQDGSVTSGDVIHINTHISPAVLSDNVIFTQDHTEITVTEVNLPTITLVWNGSGPPPLAVDDVISGTAFNGFLRRITSIDISGNVVTLQTTQAAMVDLNGDGAEEFLLGGSDSFIYVLSLDGTFQFSKPIGSMITALARIPGSAGRPDLLAVGIYTGELLIAGHNLVPVGKVQVGSDAVRDIAVLKTASGSAIVAADVEGNAIRLFLP